MTCPVAQCKDDALEMICSLEVLVLVIKNYVHQMSLLKSSSAVSDLQYYHTVSGAVVNELIHGSMLLEEVVFRQLSGNARLVEPESKRHQPRQMRPGPMLIFTDIWGPNAWDMPP